MADYTRTRHSRHRAPFSRYVTERTIYVYAHRCVSRPSVRATAPPAAPRALAGASRQIAAAEPAHELATTCEKEEREGRREGVKEAAIVCAVRCAAGRARDSVELVEFVHRELELRSSAVPKKKIST